MTNICIYILDQTPPIMNGCKSRFVYRDSLINMYPPWNSQLATENGWLEYDRFLFGAMAHFQGALAVSFRECNNPGGDGRPALGDEPMTDESSADTERWAPALAQQAAALRREMSSTGLRLLHGDASLCMEVAKSKVKNVGKTIAKWYNLTAHRQGYRVTTLYMRNGWVNPITLSRCSWDNLKMIS